MEKLEPDPDVGEHELLEALTVPPPDGLVLKLTVYDAVLVLPVNAPVSAIGAFMVIVAVVDEPVYEPVPVPVHPVNVSPDAAVAAMFTDSLTFSH